MFQYDTNELLHEMDVSILLQEHRYYVENNTPIQYVDEYGYITEGFKDILNTIKGKIKQFIEWVKHLLKKLSATMKEYWYKLQAWWKSKNYDKRKLESGLAAYNKLKKEEKVAWGYNVKPQDILNGALSQNAQSIIDKESNKATLEKDIEDIDKKYSEAKEDNEKYLDVNISEIVSFLSKGNNQLKKGLASLANMSKKVESTLYKQLADAAKNNEENEDKIACIRLKISFASKVTSKESSMLIKVANYYSSLAKAIIAKSGSKDKKDGEIPDFKDVVDSGKLMKVRILLKKYILIDRTLKTFENHLKYAESKLGNKLWDEHDNDIETDRTKWTLDYLDSQMVKVVDNFSKERINHLKELIQYFYPNGRKRS